jgi:hypothetical protein
VRGRVAPVVEVTEAVGGVLEVLPLHIQLLKERDRIRYAINGIGNTVPGYSIRNAVRSTAGLRILNHHISEQSDISDDDREWKINKNGGSLLMKTRTIRAQQECEAPYL